MTCLRSYASIAKGVKKVRAIDMHIHPPTAAFMRSVAGLETGGRTPEQIAQEFRDLDLLACPIAWDTETTTGRPAQTNDEIAQMVKDFPDVFIAGWACVDPWKGKAAIQEVERAITQLGLMGLKFQQAAQAFYPNDRRFYPLYRKCVELNIPVLFHSGTTGYGERQPGGGGVHLKYTRPIPYIDDVAADFPQLTIVAAHPSWPWQEEMIAVALHKPNVFLDLSGWAPRYFPDSLKHEINRRLQDRVMFGSDYPVISPGRWLDEFEKEGYKSEVVEKVLYKNAQNILGLRVP